MTKDSNGHNQGRTGFLLIDTKKCQGCLTCMLACSLAYTGTESMSASQFQVVQNSFGTYPHDIWLNPVQQCDLCNNASFWNRPGKPPETLACVSLCPVGAIRYSETAPSPRPDGSCEFNFRGPCWEKMGYPID